MKLSKLFSHFSIALFEELMSKFLLSWKRLYVLVEEAVKLDASMFNVYRQNEEMDNFRLLTEILQKREEFAGCDLNCEDVSQHIRNLVNELSNGTMKKPELMPPECWRNILISCKGVIPLHSKYIGELIENDALKCELSKEELLQMEKDITSQQEQWKETQFDDNLELELLKINVRRKVYY